MLINAAFSLTVVAFSNDYFENLLMSVINFDKQMYIPNIVFLEQCDLHTSAFARSCRDRLRAGCFQLLWSAPTTVSGFLRSLPEPVSDSLFLRSLSSSASLSPSFLISPALYGTHLPTTSKIPGTF